MRTRRSRILAAGAAVVATAATVAGVFALTDGDTGDGPDVAAPPPSSAAPSTSPSESTTSPSPDRTASSPSATAPVELATVPVYYLGDSSRGPRLYREFHRVPLMNGDPVSTAAFEAVAETPDDPDYRTPWPGGTTVARLGILPREAIEPALSDAPVLANSGI